MSSVSAASGAPYSVPGLLFGFLGGAVAWLLHLLTVYVLAAVACITGMNAPLHLATAGFGAVAAVSGWVAWRQWRRARADRSTVRARWQGSALVLAGAGVLLNMLFVLVIVAQWLPALVLNPCLGGGAELLWDAPRPDHLLAAVWR